MEGGFRSLLGACITVQESNLQPGNGQRTRPGQVRYLTGTRQAVLNDTEPAENRRPNNIPTRQTDAGRRLKADRKRKLAKVNLAQSDIQSGRSPRTTGRDFTCPPNHGNQRQASR